MTQLTVQPQQSSLPSQQSTDSYWHQNPSAKLTGHRTTADLPQEADVVIIGSGITGAFVAKEVVSGGRDVLMLEAREACWGATGRNGGRCEPMIYLTKPHLAAFEVATYDFLKQLISENEIPCGWESLHGVSALKTAEAVQLVKRRIEQLEVTHPELAKLMRVTEDEGEMRDLKVRGAKGVVVEGKAARCWPYKLVCWVLEDLLKTGRFNLQTTTPVVHIQRHDSGWILHTPRGQVVAKNVVLATNGYTSHLLPKFTGLITPVRGHVAALPAPRGSTPLQNSHVWLVKEDGDQGESDDYLIQRQNGDIIVGGERMCTLSGGWGVSDDSSRDEVVSRRIREALHSNITLFPEQKDEPSELDASYEWTGIMGFSSDNHPWVGAVPEKLGGGEGLWISAGYTGHGMPLAARCGVAVGEQILGKTGGIKVPEEFKLGHERAQIGLVAVHYGTQGRIGTMEDELRELVSAGDRGF